MFETKVKVDLRELEALVKRYPDASKKARMRRLTEAVNLLEREIKRETPYGAGPIHLRDTIHGAVKEYGEKTAGILGTPMEYGEPVELGTRPHFPPIGPIEHWVRVKLRLPDEIAPSVAFLIARAISRRGTKGAKMFEHGFEENRLRVENILRQIPGDITNQLGG